MLISVTVYSKDTAPDIEGIVTKIEINKKAINISNIYLKPKPDPDINSLKEIFSKPRNLTNCGNGTRRSQIG